MGEWSLSVRCGDIIISDEAQALEQYWDDYAAKGEDLRRDFERATGPVDASSGAFGRRPRLGRATEAINSGSGEAALDAGDMFDVALVEECWKHRNPPQIPEGDAEAEHGRARRRGRTSRSRSWRTWCSDEEDAGEEDAERPSRRRSPRPRRRPLPRRGRGGGPSRREPVDEWQETVKEQLAKVEEMLKDTRTTSSSRN